jgi:hypothetical protein
MTSSTPPTTSSSPTNDILSNSLIDPDFLTKCQEKRNIYQAAASADKASIEETRAAAGRNNMEDYIAEHQEFIEEQVRWSEERCKTTTKTMTLTTTSPHLSSPHLTENTEPPASS